MRLPLLAAFALFLPAAAAAHDVWMQPDRFVAAPRSVVNYRVFVGHGAAREGWDVGAARVRILQVTGSRATVDLQPARSDAGVLRLGGSGTYVVSMTSTASVSDLPALRFNDYAQAEGLEPVIALRTRLGQTQRNGRELYSRRTKMLIKVGNLRSPQPQVLRPLGLTLELVPQRDPFLIGRGQPLPFTVYYYGKPLAGATVKLTNLDADAEPVARSLTDAGGKASFSHPGPGKWQVNVVWARPLIGNRDAEYETIFSSLTFGG